MQVVVGRGRAAPTWVRAVPALVAGLALVAGSTLVGCAGSDAPTAGTTTLPAGSGTAENVASTTAADASTSADVDATPTTAEPGSSSTTEPAASEAQRSAPADGDGTALLQDVRVAAHEGYERIVFEFTATTRPGYRIQWVDGPITADGSGEPVEVAGSAHLEVIMQPASGFDTEAGVAVYTKADRVSVKDQTKLITDLVRTGDFEAVLTWVAGARERVPFTVSTLRAPTRLVIDLQTG